ncbi:hypothetical protein [Oleiharenicola lentus]|uniref:hypothetical protein n=1 Tax=Oleiharenicola lentus TaxID=2508720 RepID=UPI003F669093
MKKILPTLVLSAVFATVGFADVVSQRIQASYLIAFGRGANSGELTYWKQQNPRSVSALVAGHTQYLSQDANTHRATIRRSYIDALGREPNEGEYKHWMPGSDTYTQLMKNHVSWLSGNPGEYESVIKRSYRFVFNRPPSGDELKYWRKQGTISYAILVAAHDTWRKANPSPSAPGKTSGTATLAGSSDFLASVVVSGPVLQEAQAALGLGSTGGNVLAAGGGPLVAAGGGNLVGNDGASLVGNDGASLVGNDGASLVAAGGMNLVAAGGGN